jgi:hypothetical protein
VIPVVNATVRVTKGDSHVGKYGTVKAVTFGTVWVQFERKNRKSFIGRTFKTFSFPIGWVEVKK